MKLRAMIKKNLSRFGRNPYFVTAFVFFNLKIFSLFVSLPAQTFPDSWGYRIGDGATAWHLVSFSGKEYGRAWPIMAFYSFFKFDSERVVAQGVLSFISFYMLGLVIYNAKLFSNSRSNLLLASFPLVFSNMNHVQLWENYISRESFTLSLAILTVVFLIRFIQKQNAFDLCCTLIFSCLLTITRSHLILFFLALFALVTTIIYKNSVSRSIFSIVVLLVFTSLTATYTIWNISNQNIGWSNSDPTGQSLNDVQLSYLMSDYNPRAIQLLSALRSSSAPECMIPPTPIPTSVNPGAPMLYMPTLLHKCSGLEDWMSKDYPKFYIKFLLSNPGYILSLTKNQLGTSQSPVNFGWSTGNSFSVVPQGFESLIFSSTPNNLKVISNPQVLFFLFLVVVLYRQRREVLTSKIRQFQLIFIALSFIFQLQSVAAGIAMTTYPTEIARITFSTSVPAILFIWLGLLIEGLVYVGNRSFRLEQQQISRK